MANPTTNYGFVLPTPTDLVTDLPADFDVALQGVDTRLKALNPSTTLGDTDYASATANTNTRLPIGSAGQVLTVVSGVPAWATPAAGGGGKVLQVVYGSTSTNTANSTTTYADTTLTATITPTLSTSQILVIVNQNGCGHGAVNAIEWIRIMRGATEILEISDLIGYTASATTMFGLSVGATKLDSPATTSATTYKTQFRSEDTNTVRVQGNNSGTCNSTITLLEIGA